MKKILFCLQTMVCGGVEKELITLLNLLKSDNIDITVRLLYQQDNSVIADIPSYVNLEILDIDRRFWTSSLLTLLEERVKKYSIREAVRLLVKTVKYKGASSAFVDLNAFPQDPNWYDIAICFHMHSGLVLRYVGEKVNAKKKIAWIHNDFESTKFRVSNYEPVLEKYHNIIAVSRKIQSEFIERCPRFYNRTETIYNIVNCDDIIEKAKKEKTLEPRFQNEARVKLLTIGRLEEQKGIDIAIECCRLLRQSGFDVAWYVIGDGSVRDQYQHMISKYNLSSAFFLLGRKENPYPYLLACDYYIQPSRHEGYALTILEALVLDKTIILTDFAGAREQIVDNETGYIASQTNPITVAERIKQVFNYAKKKNLRGFVEQRNSKSIQQIKELLEIS